MDLDLLLKIIGHLASILTVVSALVAGAYAIVKRGVNIYSGYITWFFVYFLRMFLLLLIAYGAFYAVFVLLYVMILSLLFDGRFEPFWWNDQHPIRYIVAYLLAGGTYSFVIFLAAGTYITASFNFPKIFFSKLLNGNIEIKRRKKLHIINALYYTSKNSYIVTDAVRSQIFEDKLVLYAGNNLGGDPDPGVPKKLRIVYIHGSFDDPEQTVEISEGETIRLP